MWAASHEPRQVTTIGATAAGPYFSPGAVRSRAGVPPGSVMSSPRPYVAAAAASVLAAVFFVPSASASPHHSASAERPAHAASQSGRDLDLADTGAIDTKPYVIGGAAFLVAGAGLVLNAGRRSRETL
jgi:hypothetical protein